MYCTSCGKKAQTNANFCQNCGATVSSEESKSPVLIHPELGVFALNTRNAALGWEWYVSSYIFGPSGRRPVMFDRYDFVRYRKQIEKIVDLLVYIDAEQDKIIDLVRSHLKKRKCNVSRWSVALAKVDEVRIYHDNKEDVACIYFGEHVDSRGYRHARVEMSFSKNIIDVHILEVS